jgi:P pilus assembly chaperone PapD
MSKMRPALLAVALLLTVIAMISPARAACTPGTTRVIISNIACCAPAPAVRVTKQNQTCNSSGVWVNSGSSYCANNNVCAI